MDTKRPLKIAINARFLLPGKLEGIGWFSYETIKRMVQNHPDCEFHLIFDRTYAQEFVFAENCIPHVLFPQARHPILWFLFFECSVTRLLKKLKPDVFLSPDGHLSLQANCPQVLVIHDLAFEHYPEFIPNLVAKYYRYYTPLFAQKATAIATVSQASKEDIIQQYQIPPEKISVVYNGINTHFVPILDGLKAKTQESFSHGNHYFLYVGSLHPRKNISRMLLAFDRFKADTNSKTKLLIAGRRAWLLEEIEDSFESMIYKGDVIFLGHTNSDTLHKLIASARALVYISLFEGFGIPIIEAMKCGTPVLTSNVSSMDEVAGDAAYKVEPTDIGEICQGMIDLDEDEDLRTDLTRKGFVRANSFSWDKTADALWEVIESALGNHAK